jgi:phosphate starvation-inducible PhoH-like protein
MTERIIAVDRIENIISVFGSFDENVRIIENALGVTVTDRTSELHITGEAERVLQAEKAVNGLLSLAAKGEEIDGQRVRYLLKLVQDGREAEIGSLAKDVVCVTAKGKPVKAKTLGQQTYCDAIRKNTITLGNGPAGTGKT